MSGDDTSGTGGITQDDIQSLILQAAGIANGIVREKAIKNIASAAGVGVTVVKAEVAKIIKATAEMAMQEKKAKGAHLKVVDPMAPPEPPVAFTDPLEIEAVNLFRQHYGDKYRFNHSRAKWMIWTGSRWKIDDYNRAQFDMQNLVERMRTLDPDNRKGLGNIRFSREALKGASVLVHFGTIEADYDTDPMLIGTPEGYVDLKTGKHHPPDQTKLISKQIAVVPSESADCPIWEGFLEQAFEEREDIIPYMQTFFGYCLSGLMKEEIMTFVYGPGGNGKGVMLSAISKIFGDYYVNTPASTFMETRNPEHSTELARLQGARLVSASETADDSKWNLGRIKEITGNETPISARYMRQDFFEFWPVCKLMVVGNNKPSISDVDAAIGRRMRMIPMTNTPKAVDNNLKAKLHEEFPAIARWVLDGWARYQEEGLIPPAVIANASSAYLKAEDVIGGFINTVLEFRPEGRLLKSDCKAALAVFRKVNGIDAKATTTKLYKRLEESHGLSGDEWHKTKRAFHGVNIKPEFWQTFTEEQVKAGFEPSEPDEAMGGESATSKPHDYTDIPDLEVPF